MKMMNKWIIAALLVALVGSLMIGCDNTKNPGPGGNNDPTGEQTTTAPQPDDKPLEEYGNFSRVEDVKTLEQLFATAIEENEASFGQGSTYSDEKLTNVYQITDYIANYQKYVEEYGVQDQLDKIYDETGFTLDMGFAAQMMKHYLDASGETYDFSASMNDLLLSTKIKGAQSTTVNAAMVAAENLVKSGESGVNVNQTAYIRFTSLKASDGPAYYALGNFSAMADLSNVQRTGDSFTATVTFRIVDFYDWSPHDTEPLFTNQLKELDDTYRTLLGEMVDMPTLEAFNQADLAHLHLAGYAKAYASSGSIVYNVTWTAGQTFDQATVTVVTD